MARDVLHGVFPREAEKRIEESGIVRLLFASGCVKPQCDIPVMVDVGCCRGKAFIGFAEQGWQIYAFEPNPPVFNELMQTKSRPNVTLSPLAVSDVDGANVAFFTSEESLGISSLKAFRDTHKPTARVDTIRLDTFLRENGIKNIDFLKIDTEGFDLMVLKGLSLDENRPSVIVCEYEDSKTIPLGYNAMDLARHMETFGYSVYVSEWHPIIRYGGETHRWRSFQRWSQGLIDPQGWGNFIAFKFPVPENELVAAVREVADSTAKRRARDSKMRASEKPGVSRPSTSIAASTAPTNTKSAASKTQEPGSLGSRKGPSQSTARLSASARGSRLKSRSLALFRIGQVIIWVFRAIRRRALIAAGGAIILAALAIAPAYPPLWPYRILFWSTAGVVVLVGLGGILAALANEVLRRLQNAQKKARRADSAQLRSLLRGLQNAQKTARRADSAQVRSLSFRLDRLEAEITDRIEASAKLRSLSFRLDRLEAEILDRIEAQINGANVRSEDAARKLGAVISRLAKVDEVSSVLEAQVSEITSRFEELERIVRQA
jgi:FkbM family methyltransferase